MPVICPTCQIVETSLAHSSGAAYSRACTGGVPCFAGGALCLAGTDSADRIGGGALAIAVGCCFPAEPSRAARRARYDEVERRIPQERAIDGPAAYPMNAPATAPTGPKTTAPDTAPRAA